MSGIEAGRLTVVTPSGQRIEHLASQDGPEAVLVFHRWRALQRLITGGDIGFAEAYIAGEWSTPDLATAHRDAGKELPLIILSTRSSGGCRHRAVNRLRHLINRNSKTGSRRNIAFHYDLGNDFYRLFSIRPSQVKRNQVLFRRPLATAARGSALLFGISRLALPAWDQENGAAQSDSRPHRALHDRHKSQGELTPSIVPRGTSPPV